jgi:hypothetical protein
MKQRRLLRALCIVCTALVSSPSWAATIATVDPSHGDVLVNRGKGFNQIKRPVRVAVGNSVMVGPDSLAIIAYRDGCTVKVAPGTVETVAALSPCASGASAQSQPSYSQNTNWCWNSPDTNNYVGNCAFWALWGSAVGFIVYTAISP